MNFVYKEVPTGTKIYRSLENCCKHQQVLPCGVQPVLNSLGKAVGFAKLPSKSEGATIIWTTP